MQAPTATTRHENLKIKLITVTIVFFSLFSSHVANQLLTKSISTSAAAGATTELSWGEPAFPVSKV